MCEEINFDSLLSLEDNGQYNPNRLRNSSTWKVGSIWRLYIKRLYRSTDEVNNSVNTIEDASSDSHRAIRSLNNFGWDIVFYRKLFS